MKRRTLGWGTFALGITLAFSLAGCSAAAVANVPATPTLGVPTPTETFGPGIGANAVTPTIQETMLGAHPCTMTTDADVANLMGYHKIPAPSGSILVGRGAMASDGMTASMDADLFGVCAKGMTPDAVVAFYVARMPAGGWTRATAASDPNLPCGNRPCWKQPEQNNTTPFVRLQDMQVVGSDVEFTIVDGDYSHT